VMVPNLIKEMTSQIAIYEPRAIIQRVTYVIDESHVTFTLTWITSDAQTGITTFNLTQ